MIIIDNMDTGFINPEVEFKLMRSVLSFDPEYFTLVKELEEVYFSKKKAKNIKVINIIKIMNYIKKTKENINVDVIIKIYGMVRNNKLISLNSENIKNILDEYNKNNNLFGLFISIISSYLFLEESFLMALLILNFNYYRLYQKFYNINRTSKNFILKYIRVGNYLELKNSIDIVNEMNKKYHIPKNTYNLEELKKIINNIPEKQLNKHYIKNIYVYGSHATHRENIFSDIDLLLEIDCDFNLNHIAIEIFEELKYIIKNIDIKTIYYNKKLSIEHMFLFRNKVLLRAV